MKKLFNIKLYTVVAIFLLISPLELKSQVLLQNIRHGEHAGYDRLVFDFTGPTRYRITEQSTNRKIELELFDCFSYSFSDGSVRNIDDGLLQSFTVNMSPDGKMRISIQIIPQYRYHLFKMDAPWRLVLDIFKTNLVSPQKRTMQNNAQETNTTEASTPKVPDNIITPTLKKEFLPGERKSPYNEIREQTIKLQNVPSPTERNTLVLVKSASPVTVPKKLANQTSRKKSRKSSSFTILLISAFLINCILFLGYIVYAKKRTELQRIQAYHKFPLKSAREQSRNHDFKSIMNNKLKLFSPDMENKIQPGKGPPGALPEKNRSKHTGQNFHFPKKRVRRYLLSSQNDVQETVSLVRERVLKMAQAHYDIKAIAKEMSLGQDEIKMIINLKNKEDTKRAVLNTGTQNRFVFA